MCYKKYYKQNHRQSQTGDVRLNVLRKTNALAGWGCTAIKEPLQWQAEVTVVPMKICLCRRQWKYEMIVGNFCFSFSWMCFLSVLHSLAIAAIGNKAIGEWATSSPVRNQVCETSCVSLEKHLPCLSLTNSHGIFWSDESWPETKSFPGTVIEPRHFWLTVAKN